MFWYGMPSLFCTGYFLLDSTVRRRLYADMAITFLFCEKRTINVLDKINYDKGDMRLLAPYWLRGIKMRYKEFDDAFY